MLGPQVWVRGLKAAIVEGHGMGPIEGDVFRMPGVFGLVDGKVVDEVRADYSSDRPDYGQIVDQLAESTFGDEKVRQEPVGA